MNEILKVFFTSPFFYILYFSIFSIGLVILIQRALRKIDHRLNTHIEIMVRHREMIRDLQAKIK